MSDAPGRRPELLALGQVIRTARLDGRIKAVDLADAAGISPRYLSRLETGRGNPTVNVLMAIAEAVGLSASTLLRRAEADTDD